MAICTTRQHLVTGPTVRSPFRRTTGAHEMSPTHLPPAHRFPVRSSAQPLSGGAASWRRALFALAALALLVGCSGSSSEDGAPSDDTGDTTAPSNEPETTTTTEAATAVGTGEVATGEPVPSAGCGTTTAGTAELERHDVGTDRFYLLSSPPDPDADEPLPVVLDLHGLLEGAQVHSQQSAFGPYAAENGFLAVFPHGSGDPVGWDVDLDRVTNPDLVFLDAVLDQVEAERCVDTSRVYATGLSFGAIMSSTLGCVMTDRIAAIAPVDGITVPEGCDPERPVPVLTFHGTLDPILPFNGGPGNLGAILGGSDAETEAPEVDLDGPGYPETVASWAAMNDCDTEPTDEDLTASVIERTWECPAGSPVVFDIMVGAGHSWPGSEFSKSIESILGPTDMSIDGTDLIWKFFQRFQLPPA